MLATSEVCVLCHIACITHVRIWSAGDKYSIAGVVLMETGKVRYTETCKQK